MSGGAYNYLCLVDELSDICEREESLERMARALSDLGHDDAAQETYDVLHEIQAMRSRFQSHMNRLKSVWMAVEWVASCDWGPESIEKAIAEYRDPSGSRKENHA